MSIVEKYRQKIRNMDFTPLSDSEVNQAKERHQKALINAGIEGIFCSDEELEFFSMLHHERVPHSLAREITTEWIKETA